MFMHFNGEYSFPRFSSYNVLPSEYKTCVNFCYLISFLSYNSNNFYSY
nr:MAG TPA: hypothetical protein [Caudoviricetes sp.]